jgi:hypothetical protein
MLSQLSIRKPAEPLGQNPYERSADNEHHQQCYDDSRDSLLQRSEHIPARAKSTGENGRKNDFAT